MKFSMGRGSRESRENTKWAIQNRYPFTTRGSLEGRDARDPHSRRHISSNRPYAARLIADREAGIVTYEVWGRWNPICHYTRGKWVVSRDNFYNKEAEMVRQSVNISGRNEVV